MIGIWKGLNLKINSKLIADIRYIWSFLGKNRRWQFAGLFLLMLLSFFAEMVSLGAVVPFIGVLTAPEQMMKFEWIRTVMQLLDISSADELLIYLTAGFIVVAFLAAGIRILLLWANTWLSAAMGIQLRSEIYKRTLYQPYNFHIANNSSDLISIVTEKVSLVQNVGIMHILMFMTAIFTSSGIIIMLLLIDPMVAFLTFVVLGGGYLLMGSFSRKLLRKNSQKIARSQPLAIKQLQEGIGGIRDVILDHSQETFLAQYKKYVTEIQKASNQNGFISQLPKYVLELLGIVLIAGLAYYLYMQGRESLPVLAALALGAQRLLPALQQIYFSWSQIVGGQAAIADVVGYMGKEIPVSIVRSEERTSISFDTSIELKDVKFSYTGSNTGALNGISLEISKGAKVGFIGPTGCGKSTLLDLIMGLLKPTNGQLLIDGEPLKPSNIQDWQQKIAHVPQSIYLSDNSIEENIAFGVPKEQIDRSRVEQAAKQAHMDEFIAGLARGYETVVGERGVQLSGGQRQRIGIARALYKQAEVIVFDEATSALDDATEKIIMETINDLDEGLTTLMIAHRLSTLESCDTVYRLADGKIVESGSYEQVCQKLEYIKI